MTKKEHTGVDLIRAERARQIADEGYRPDDDDQHTLGEIALAAVCYASPLRIFAHRVLSAGHFEFYDPFPWNRDKRKQHEDASECPDPATYPPLKRIELLTKAGALIAAEIDRLARIERRRAERKGSRP